MLLSSLQQLAVRLDRRRTKPRSFLIVIRMFLRMVAEGEGSQSANPTETAISLDELKSLRGDR